MRYCSYCKKPMHTSINSIWIGKKNFDIHVKCEKEYNQNISPCPNCNCMTKSIRLGRAKYVCGKCKADKSLSDVYFYEAMQKVKSEEEK